MGSSFNNQICFSGQLFNYLVLVLARLCPTDDPGFFLLAVNSQFPIQSCHLHGHVLGFIPLSKSPPPGPSPQPPSLPGLPVLLALSIAFWSFLLKDSAYTSPQRGPLQRPHLMALCTFPSYFSSHRAALLSSKNLSSLKLTYVFTSFLFYCLCRTLSASPAVVSQGLEQCLVCGRYSVNIC